MFLGVDKSQMKKKKYLPESKSIQSMELWVNNAVQKTKRREGGKRYHMRKVMRVKVQWYNSKVKKKMNEGEDII